MISVAFEYTFSLYASASARIFSQRLPSSPYSPATSSNLAIVLLVYALSLFKAQNSLIVSSNFKFLYKIKSSIILYINTPYFTEQ